MNEAQTKSPKKPYTPPCIKVFGAIEAITLGTASGQFTDAAFPQHTFFKDLTFS